MACSTVSHAKKHCIWDALSICWPFGADRCGGRRARWNSGPSIPGEGCNYWRSAIAAVRQAIQKAYIGPVARAIDGAGA